jgi:hypothetical protein
MQAVGFPELDIALVETEVERNLELVSPADVELGLHTLARLPPARWTLEWHLPWWLGQAYGLGPGLASELVVANLLGLLAVRIQDDLIDGELPQADLVAAQRMAPVLLETAIGTYRTLLEPGSPFWPFVDDSLAAWRRASRTSAAAAPPLGLELADRGAPLRIPAYAICLLTGRPDRWPGLKGCLDHALAALVRYDQVVDWEADLAAGRWNVFVAAISPQPQDAGYREQNRSAVHTAMLTEGVVAREFGRVESDAVRAAVLARRLGCPPLAAFLCDYAARTAAQGEAMERHYRGLADDAVALLFGPRRAPDQGRSLPSGSGLAARKSGREEETS